MEISEEAKDILQEVINIGIGAAAVTFSEIMGREIRLSFPNLLILNLDGLKEYLKEKEIAEYVSVSQGFGGGLVGKGIVSFPLQDGKTLINKLLQSHDSNDPDFGILERETIMEVGNVLINSVACSISDMVEVEAKYEMPEITISDQVFSIEDASPENVYCIGEGEFSVEGVDIKGMMLFILTYNKIEHIINKLTF